MSYPPKETEHDSNQMQTHKLIKSQAISSSAVSSSSSLSSSLAQSLAMHNMPTAGTATFINDSLSRTIPLQIDSAFSQQDFVSSSSKFTMHNTLDKLNGRYSVHKHELPNFVSDSVSPRATTSTEGLNHPTHQHHHSSTFYQPHSLPSPSSSTSSQASKTNSVPTLFGSYSPSPFTVNFLEIN